MTAALSTGADPGGSAHRLGVVLAGIAAILKREPSTAGDRRAPVTLAHVDGREVALHLECDGPAKYEGGASLEDERERADALRSMGHVVVHATSAQIRRDGVAWLRTNLLAHVPVEVRRALRPVPMFAPAWRPGVPTR